MSYRDNLEIIGVEPIIVLARIRLLTAEEGGRNSPVTSACKFRPNHNFGEPDNRNFFIGQVEISENETLFLGEPKDLLITFFNVRGLIENLIVGRKWRIQAGSELWGIGEVLKVVSS